ncbi:TonB-dependent siderophore receptor [uncultured Caulobacter sp.]|uniref:TonB-dependent siderophore receptor n=1 Tax=uncultured Caulobacter sp. TaxID=158749 RepID=UPI0026389A57|nr:TonB-dependent receptor [uncultured Caulobacter sp.]
MSRLAAARGAYIATVSILPILVQFAPVVAEARQGPAATPPAANAPAKVEAAPSSREARKAQRRAAKAREDQARTDAIVREEKDGVLSEIVVVARRDEAETSVLVRGETGSTRTGQSLRDQARNAQVISAKLLAEQQAQSLPEALRNAGGVTVNTATVQGGVTYSVRGFSSGGAVNGMPTPSSSSFAAGSTQPIANIERLEVLKGPDAILLGGDSLGGTVNIVTKKPSTEQQLYVTGEAGSFGAGRVTLDANGAVSEDQRFSARVIATAAGADHNAGGYRGNEDFLFAPSLRFKTAKSDVIASVTLGSQVFGMVPYTLFNDRTNEAYPTDRAKPLVGDKDQYAKIAGVTYDLQAKQQVKSWMLVSGHYQHQETSLLLRQYSPFAVLAPNGLLLLSRSGVKQHSVNNAVDGYARFAATTGSVEHKLVVGGMASDYDIVADNAAYSDGPGMFTYNYQTKQGTLYPLASQYQRAYRVTGKQSSYYAQYLAKAWKLAFMASVRKTNSESTSEIVGRPTAQYRSNGAVTPSYGVVANLTDNLSVYGSLAYGFIPSFSTDRFLNLLPDNHTRNQEAGVKLDLFNKRVLVNASWFSLRESNHLFNDPVAPRYQIAGPGQLGEGVDLSVSGEPVRGLLVSGGFTRTDYSLLSPSTKNGTTVTKAPRDQYSLYASYRRRIAEGAVAGLGGGVYGRSSAAIDRFGVNHIPATNQVDLNAFVTVRSVDLRLGVRNVFDRVNYGVTPATSYVPLGEPRTWRLTVGYRFR